MKRFSIWVLLLFWLTACGTTITIRLPDRPTAAPSAVPTASPTATQVALRLSATTTANVNFRIAPNTNNTPITVVTTGTTVQLTGRLSDNTWAYASLLDGRQGWMYTQNLNILGNIILLPVLTPAPVPTATPRPTLDPTPTREVRGERISYNINGEGVPDTNYLLDVMTSPCKTTALVMNNLALAVRIKELCPNTIVVSRGYSPLEGDEWYYRSAQNFVAQWQREGHREIVRHSTNEPSFGRGDRLREFVRAEIELMRQARAAGFTVAMGNFSVGIFEASDIGAGLFDDYIRALNQYGHYLALHEYSLGVLAFGTGQWSPQCLLDRLCVQPERWPTANSLPTRMIRQDGIEQFPSYWYLRRGDWWLLRADQIGVARPRILVTEFGWDNLPNIKPVIEPLRSQFGIDRYFRDMRGVNTYQNLWRWYWPNWSFSEAACRQLLWADTVYPSEYIGFALFTWSTNPSWVSFDFSGRENPAHFELHRCLEAN